MKTQTLLCLLLLTTSLNTLALSDKNRTAIQTVIDAFKSRDAEKIVDSIHLPLSSRYPAPDIRTARDLRLRLNEVIDNDLINEIANSDPDKDWQLVGWRGLMLNNGIVWVSEGGKIYAINKTTQAASDINKAYFETQKSWLHKSVATFSTARLLLITEKFLVRIDRTEDGQYRYASWDANQLQSEKPSLVLYSKQLNYYGTGGNHAYTFKNGNIEYVVEVNYIGTDDTPPAALIVKQNGNEIVNQAAVEFFGK